jgi:hypothetical protein
LEQYATGGTPSAINEVRRPISAKKPSPPTAEQPLEQKPRRRRSNVNVPKNDAERADFAQGFSTKPMIARTPLSQSMTSVKGEFKKIAAMAAAGSR